MRSAAAVTGMSKAAPTVGCPHCGRGGTVEIPPSRDTDGDLDESRLKGSEVNCPHCGDEFSFYYY
jgi:endogenous inhibitor of DNA gyrase (YacG/DUF329 family)